MIVMSCDDMNKFLYVCVTFASRMHKFSICDVIASAEKWFPVVASQDLEKFRFPGGNPRRGGSSDGNLSSTFNDGDKVRILEKKKKFDKGKQIFSKELYTIDKKEGYKILVKMSKEN
jgi:hypothetical protein